MRVLIAGSRTITQEARLHAVLDRLHAETPFTEVIAGGARGADRLAARWARKRNLPLMEVHADWERHGRSAGYRRNTEMLERGPQLVVAFVDRPWRESKGTAHTIRGAIDRQIPTRVFRLAR